MIISDIYQLFIYYMVIFSFGLSFEIEYLNYKKYLKLMLIK